MAALIRIACFSLLVLFSSAWIANALEAAAVHDFTTSSKKVALENANGGTGMGKKYGGRKMGIDEGGNGKLSSVNQVAIGKSSSTRYADVDHRNVAPENAGSIAFNEDYHAPRHHPPKNN